MNSHALGVPGSPVRASLPTRPPVPLQATRGFSTADVLAIEAEMVRERGRAAKADQTLLDALIAQKQEKATGVGSAVVEARTTEAPAEESPRKKLKNAPRPLRSPILQRRDYEVLLWLTRVRFATTAQLMRRFWADPRCWQYKSIPDEMTAAEAQAICADPDQQVPWVNRSTVVNLMHRLKQRGLVECWNPHKWISVWQPTARGYREVDFYFPDRAPTTYIAGGAVETALHTLAVVDLTVAFETGAYSVRQASGPVQVVTEREMKALEFAANPNLFTKPERRLLRKTGTTTRPLLWAAVGLSTRDGRDEYWLKWPDLALAYLTPDGSRRIAVEYERSRKSSKDQQGRGDDYPSILRAYQRSAVSGLYNGLWYVCETPAIERLVLAAKQTVESDPGESRFDPARGGYYREQVSVPVSTVVRASPQHSEYPLRPKYDLTTLATMEGAA